MPEAHLDLAWPAYAAEIGWRVATVRRLRHVSQTELAGVTGLSRSQVQNIEQSKTYRRNEAGNTTLKTLFVIAQALGVPPTIFIPDQTPQPTYGEAGREALAHAMEEQLRVMPLPSSTRTSARVSL